MVFLVLFTSKIYIIGAIAVGGAVAATNDCTKFAIDTETDNLL